MSAPASVAPLRTSILALLAIAQTSIAPAPGAPDPSAAAAARAVTSAAAPPSAVERVEALRKGRRAEAEALLTALAGTGDAEERAAAKGGLARIDLAAGLADRAVVGLEEAARMHREAGRSADALRDELARAYALYHDLRRFDDARRVLAGCHALAAGLPDGRARTLYHEGALAHDTGDVREALRLLRASADEARRVGLDAHRVGALSLQASILLALDRVAEGEALLAEAAGVAGGTACGRADLQTNLGWFGLLASLREPAPAPRLAKARRALDEALALYRGACDSAPDRANVLVNLARIALEEGAVAEARDRLDEAAREQPEPPAEVAAYRLDVEGRLLLRASRGAPALAAYDRLAQLAAAAWLPDARWRAEVGRGEAFEALGRVADAATAYEAAEALLDDHARLVPAAEGRAGFLGGLEEGARRGVELLWRRDPPRAAAIARRARRRALAQLAWSDRLATLAPDERAGWESAVAAYLRDRDAAEALTEDGWRLSGAALARAIEAQKRGRTDLRTRLDAALAALGHPGEGALATPPEGALWLAYFPATAGLVGFAITERGTSARRLDAVAPGAGGEALARALLAPFEPDIAAARALRVLAYGALDGVDLHALPWRGAPLVAAIPVAYALDRRAPAGDVGAEAEAATALVVANPRGDLRGAKVESEAVIRALTGSGFAVASLYGPAATHRAVLDDLDRRAPALLHYAGHGAFGGLEGWDSGLPLAAGGFLTVSDVLARGRVPGLVVLSGCETARSGGARSGGIGLAQAFVVAGASAVVAATRPLDDTVAARVMTAFYEAPPRDADAAAARLREAARSALRDDPPGDWASFRLIVP